MNLSRRKFLTHSLVAAGASITATSLPVMASSHTNQSNLDLRAVQYAWDKTMSLSPASYLAKQSGKNNKENVAKWSRVDFREKRVITVDGLVLSQSEAAFLLK